MKIDYNNLNLLNDENRFKFSFLCIKHVFSHVKQSVLENFKNSNESLQIKSMKAIESWLKTPTSENYQQIKQILVDLSEMTEIGNYNERMSTLSLSLLARAISLAENGSSLRTISNLSIVAMNEKDAQKEQNWQEKLLDYLLQQQKTGKELNSNLENVDDPYSLAREIAMKVQSGEVEKGGLGYRSQINNFLKDVSPEDKELVIDYLKKHKVYENLKKAIKEEVLRILK